MTFKIFVLLLGVTLWGQSLGDNTKFSLSLLDAIEQKNGGVQSNDNIVISPASIESVLSILLAGSAGETAKQFSDAIQNGDLTQKQNEQFHQGNDYYKSTNLLAMQNQYPVKQSFLDQVVGTFDAKILTENFQTRSDQATLELNNWISNQTNGNVQKLFQSDIDFKTKLLLLNTQHFTAHWQWPIYQDQTQKQPFTLSNGQTVQVDMMNFMYYYNYAKFDDGELIQLPYRDDGLSFIAFLPDKQMISNAKSFSSLFNRIPLNERISQLQMLITYMGMPRFRMTQTQATSLRPHLQQLGIEDAFIEHRADFSPIDGTKSLFLSDALHQVSMGWNETETNIDVATSSEIDYSLGAGGGIYPTPVTIVLNLDRPFLFLIRDVRKPDPSILFAGVVHKP